MPNPVLPRPLAELIGGTDDADLLVRLRRKDPDAIGLLYDRYGRTAYSLAFRILGDSAAAESAVSEATLKCWNRVSSFRQARGSALGTWLLLTTYISAMHYLKGRGARADEWADRPRPLEQGPIFHGWSKEMDGDHVQALFAGLQKLEPQERQVLDQAFFEGLSLAELAASLGCSSVDLDRLILSALTKLASLE